jgi:hypothetical protein
MSVAGAMLLEFNTPQQEGWQIERRNLSEN